MSNTWRFIFLIGAFMLAGMAVYAIWFNGPLPVIFAKAFLTLVIGGLLLSVGQSALKKASEPDET